MILNSFNEINVIKIQSFNIIPKNIVKYIVGNVKNLSMIFVVDGKRSMIAAGIQSLHLFNEWGNSTLANVDLLLLMIRKLPSNFFLCHFFL